MFEHFVVSRHLKQKSCVFFKKKSKWYNVIAYCHAARWARDSGKQISTTIEDRCYVKKRYMCHNSQVNLANILQYC